MCSGVDVYTAIAGATGALYGPLHGGANEVYILHLFTTYFWIIISLFLGKLYLLIMITCDLI